MTLVELAVVVLVLACLAGLAIPRMNKIMRHYRLEQTAHRVMEDLRLARNCAIRDKAPRYVIFEGDQYRYYLPDLRDPDHPEQEQPYTVVMDPTKGSSVAMLGGLFQNTGCLFFNALGIPNSGGTVMLSDGVEDALIEVSATTGRVSLRFQPAALPLPPPEL